MIKKITYLFIVISIVLFGWYIIKKPTHKHDGTLTSIDEKITLRVDVSDYVSGDGYTEIGVCKLCGKVVNVIESREGFYSNFPTGPYVIPNGVYQTNNPAYESGYLAAKREIELEQEAAIERIGSVFVCNWSFGNGYGQEIDATFLKTLPNDNTYLTMMGIQNTNSPALIIIDTENKRIYEKIYFTVPKGGAIILDGAGR